MLELLFHGAAGEVTGSMHMLRTAAGWIALDCGLFQGRREESDAKNRAWPVQPAEIRAVVLSHAHTDHTGRLPRLVRDGYEGPIYCTPATRDLCAIMLPDSAHIQEEDVKYVNKKRARHGLGPVGPLYDQASALAAVRLMHGVPYDRWFEAERGVRVRYRDAGHMLGSAGVEVEIDGTGANGAARVYFTGDVGSPNKPILRDPVEFPTADHVICESTYGGLINESVENAKQTITDVVNRTCGRGGKVIIPAFSVGRTQTIVYFLHEQMAAGNIPKVPVFVDSPLSVNATTVFRLHPDCFDDEARAFQKKTGDMLGAGCCTYINDVEESIRLHRRRAPCVIISASGMCESGRILHHLKNNIGNRKNAVLLPGFQAANTLGRRMAEGAETVNIFHERYPVRAEVVQVHGFSGHADQADLLRMLAPIAPSTKNIFLVHGEPEQRDTLATLLRHRGFASVTTPARGDRVTL